MSDKTFFFFFTGLCTYCFIVSTIGFLYEGTTTPWFWLLMMLFYGVSAVWFYKKSKKIK